MKPIVKLRIEVMAFGAIGMVIILMLGPLCVRECTVSKKEVEITREHNIRTVLRILATDAALNTKVRGLIAKGATVNEAVATVCVEEKMILRQRKYPGIKPMFGKVGNLWSMQDVDGKKYDIIETDDGFALVLEATTLPSAKTRPGAL
jgi:hypothetical protein